MSISQHIMSMWPTYIGIIVGNILGLFIFPSTDFRHRLFASGLTLLIMIALGGREGYRKVATKEVNQNMNKLSSRTRAFFLNTFASLGIHWAFTRPDSFLTRGESFLLSIICLCHLELSADIRRLKRKEE